MKKFLVYSIPVICLFIMFYLYCAVTYSTFDVSKMEKGFKGTAFGVWVFVSLCFLMIKGMAEVNKPK